MKNKLYKHYYTCYNCGRRYGSDEKELTIHRCPICARGRGGIIGPLKVLEKQIPRDPKKIAKKKNKTKEIKNYGVRVLLLKEVEDNVSQLAEDLE